jgi:hypothetical protein
MPKITSLSDLSNLRNEQSAVGTLNTNNDRIEAAIENTISRDGSTPNSMEADFDLNGHTILNIDGLDMNSTRITGLVEAVASDEPVRKAEFDTLETTVSTVAASIAAAQTAAAAAAVSAAAAETSYDNFDDRYLGAKASDPTLDNDGNALLTGALYWNTVSSELRVYTGTVWDNSAVSPHIHAIADVTNLQSSLDAKAPLASPTFTGVPAAPTAVDGTNTTQLATTAFVQAAITLIKNGVAAAGDTLAELYTLISGHITDVANPHSVTKTQVGLGNVTNNVQVVDPAGNGLVARTASGAASARTITAPAAGITVTDGDGVAGNPTLVLADDLAALEALTGTSTIYYRSAANTWSAVTISTTLDFTTGTLGRAALTGDVTAAAGSNAMTIADDVVTYAKMQNISATSRILGRKTAAAGDTEECTLSEVLDFVGSAAQGDILYRGAATWTRLGAGTSGQFLKTQGTGANPIWDSPSGAGDVVGPASSTDNAAARFDSTTGKLLQNGALLIADTTGAISRSGGGGIQQQGTNTNDNAAAGEVGEYVSATVVSGSAVSITANTAVTITSISLTAGDWDVDGIFIATGNAATKVKLIYPSFSTTNNTRDATIGNYAYTNYGATGVTVFAESAVAQIMPTVRYSLSGTTTVYLIGDVDFDTSTCSGYGMMRARRVR